MNELSLASSVTVGFMMMINDLFGGNGMKRKTYSIGEFSEKTGISIRTLHYYDEIGLLRPEKHPASGHRIYHHHDIMTLQRILSLKFLGYSLHQIAEMLNEPGFSVDFIETLQLHMEALEKKKNQIEKSINAIKRVIRLLKEEGEVESDVLFSLIHGWQTENRQNEWLEKHELTDVMEMLHKTSEDEKVALDRTFLQFSRKVKQLYGTPVEDPKVQEMLETYLMDTYNIFGKDMIKQLAEADVEELDIQELEEMASSPFTEEEQKWLNEAMEYYMKQAETE
jgi:DNA-binding transcriptional MerR regulator